MSSILDQIVTSTRQTVAADKEREPLAVLEAKLAQAKPVRNFRAALERRPGVAIIAEVKKASPSAGVLREDFDPVSIARSYAAGGADAISVLTEERHFQGKLSHLSAVRSAVEPPVLRKDFIIDAYQLVQARVAGADAVLLIAEILTNPELRALLRKTTDLGMQALVELHDRKNLARVVDSGATLIGINNRDLTTFETRLRQTLDLAPDVPRDRCLVSESGIKTRDDLALLADAGVRAVLVGEAFMRSPFPGDAVLALRG